MSFVMEGPYPKRNLLLLEGTLKNIFLSVGDYDLLIKHLREESLANQKEDQLNSKLYFRR